MLSKKYSLFVEENPIVGFNHFRFHIAHSSIHSLRVHPVFSEAYHCAIDDHCKIEPVHVTKQTYFKSLRMYFTRFSTPKLEI